MKRRPLTVGISPEANIDPDEVRRFVAPEPQRSRQPDPSPTTLPVETDLAAAPRPRLQSSGVRPVGLIPVTVRLRPELAGALKRASLQRQLAGEPIFTQQDLVELALEPWLRRQGYL
jgi:hypothetical protein